MPDAALPTLQYADLPARWGVSCEQTPSAFRLAIEPGGWRSITPGHVVAIAVLLVFAGFPTLTSPRTGGIVWPAIIANGILFLLPVVIIVSFLWQRFRHRILFVVTADSFTHLTAGAAPRGRRTTLPRAEIGYVKRNPYSNQLTVQHVGRDLLEFYVSPNRDVVEYVAAQLEHALAHPPAEGADRDTLPPAPPPRRWPRPLILALCGASAVASIALLILRPEYIGFSCYLFALAAIPAGILFGTQPKKFWV